MYQYFIGNITVIDHSLTAEMIGVGDIYAKYWMTYTRSRPSKSKKTTDCPQIWVKISIYTWRLNYTLNLKKLTSLLNYHNAKIADSIITLPLCLPTNPPFGSTQ